MSDTERAKVMRYVRKLERAFEYLRPRMVGDSIRGIPPNGESLAGSILSRAMCQVMMAQYHKEYPESCPPKSAKSAR